MTHSHDQLEPTNMYLKLIAAALGFAALTAFATTPASANTALDTAVGSVAQMDMTPSGYCGCGRRYVRYYTPVRYYVRVRYVRYVY